MNKTLVFDMDGTLNEFYHVEGWLSSLKAGKTNPYTQAKPKYDMRRLNKAVRTLKAQGYKIVIVSWLSKTSTPEYDRKVTRVKLNWLKKHHFPYDEIHIVPYGTAKNSFFKDNQAGAILFDDEEKNLQEWQIGKAINSSSGMLEVLEGLGEKK